MKLEIKRLRSAAVLLVSSMRVHFVSVQNSQLTKIEGLTKAASQWVHEAGKQQDALP